MSRLFALAAALFVALVAASAQASASDIPRVVVGLHDGALETSSLAASVPALNHLGLVLEPHDATAALPDLSRRTDIRGVVIWLDLGHVQDTAGLTPWVKELARRDIPVVLMGIPPDAEDRFGLFLSLGLIFTQDERSYTYDLRAVERDSDLVDFERRFDNLFLRTDIIRPLDPTMSRSLLVLQRRGDVPDRTHPLIVTPKGGYGAEGYALWRQPNGVARQWYVDPVAFFRLAFRMQDVPAPDPTTLNARRILAPRLAPASPSDGIAIAGVMRAANGIGDAIDLRPVADASSVGGGTSVPPPGQVCRDKVRSLLFGYAGTLVRLADAGEPYRMAAAAPVFQVCRGEEDLMPRAIATVMGALAAMPLIPDRGQLEEIEAAFPAVRLDQVGPMSWRIRDRGALQTIRFDDADDRRIDWTASEGVLGAGRWHGSLYVSLDPDAAEPVVTLTRAAWASPPFPTLVESRWIVERLVRSPESASMTVSGTGFGDMVWSCQPGSRWEIRLTDAAGRVQRLRAQASEDGLLSLSLPPFADGTGTLELRRHGTETVP